MPFEEQQKRESVETGLLAGLAGLGLRSLNWDQRMAEATQSAAHRKLFDEAPPKVEDDMNIVLGNVTNTSPPTNGSLLGTAAKVALAVGLLGTGVGAGAAIPLVLDAIRDMKGTTTITTEQGPRYLLELGEPVAP